MAAYNTRKQGTAARARTIAARQARAVKHGATATTRTGRVRQNRTR